MKNVIIHKQLCDAAVFYPKVILKNIVISLLYSIHFCCAYVFWTAFQWTM